MKAKTVLLITFALLLLAGVVGCGKKEKIVTKDYSCDCLEEKIVIKTIENEPAVIKYNKLVETLTIELTDSKSANEHFLIPCNDSFPEEYKIEGMQVLVSGELFTCSERNRPEYRIIPYYIIKLSTIQNTRP